MRIPSVIKPVAAAFALLAACGVAAGEQQPAVVRRAAETIQNEQKQQQRLRHQLDVIVEEVSLIIEDLSANEMFDEAGGERFARIAESLSRISKENILHAAELLESAYRAMPQPYEPLEGAAAEIRSAAERLNRLVQDIATSSAMEEIQRDLIQMLSQQEEIHRLSTDVADKHYREGKNTESEGRLLSNEQTLMAENARRFGEQLRRVLESVQQPHDRAVFAHIKQSMSEGRLVEHLNQAADSLKTQDYLTAMSHQKEVISVLEVMLSAPKTGVDNPLLWLRRQLFEISGAQEKLTVKTDATPPDEFQDASSGLNEEQMALYRALEDVMQDPVSAEPVMLRELLAEQEDMARQVTRYDAFGRDLAELQPVQDEIARKVSNMAMTASQPAIRDVLQRAEFEMRDVSFALADNEPELAAEPIRLASEALSLAAQLSETSLEGQAFHVGSVEEPLSEALSEMNLAAGSITDYEQARAVEHQRRVESILDKVISQLDDIIRQFFEESFGLEWSEQLDVLYRIARQLEGVIEEQEGIRQQTQARAERDEDVQTLESPQRQLSDKCLAVVREAILPLPEHLQELIVSAALVMAEAATSLDAGEPANALAAQQEALAILRRARNELYEFIADLEAQWEEMQKMLAELTFALEVLQRIVRLEREQQNLYHDSTRFVRHNRGLDHVYDPQQGIAGRTQSLIVFAEGNPAVEELQGAHEAMERAVKALVDWANNTDEVLEAQREAIERLWLARYAAEEFVRMLCRQMGIDFYIMHGMWDSGLPSEIEPPAPASIDMSFMEELIFGEDFPDGIESGGGGQGISFQGIAGGPAPADRHSTWHHLEERERDALRQNFSGELPIDYREILKAYFEDLAID